MSGEGFVGEKLQGCEGDGHGECCGVGNVESGESFGAVDITGAVGHGFVHFVGVVDLHALFDDFTILA